MGLLEAGGRVGRWNKAGLIGDGGGIPLCCCW